MTSINAVEYLNDIKKYQLICIVNKNVYECEF